MDDLERRIARLEAYVRALEIRIKLLESGNAANSAAASAGAG
jgi:hypothetical protein